MNTARGIHIHNTGYTLSYCGYIRIIDISRIYAVSLKIDINIKR